MSDKANKFQNINDAGPVIRGIQFSYSPSHSPSPSQLTPPSFKHLLTGIDTLHLCLTVLWHNNVLFKSLNRKKIGMYDNDKVLWKHPEVGDLVLYNRGMSRYPYHLQSPHFDAFLNQSSCCNYPNVLVQIRSESLWNMGLNKNIRVIKNFIRKLGGTINNILINRVDLCCDFYVENGLSYDFLVSHKVSRCRSFKVHGNGANNLQTFYVGSRQSSGGIHCRIYNRSALIKKNNKHFNLYNNIAPKHFDSIWRVEFEINRKALRRFDINTVGDLESCSASLWSYLTKRWLSFKIPSDANSARRAVHPWWQAVQNCAKDFGKPFDIKSRKRQHHQPDFSWYISHLAGFLPALGVLTHTSDLDCLLKKLPGMLKLHWRDKNFDKACRAKVIQLGVKLDPVEEEVIPMD